MDIVNKIKEIILIPLNIIEVIFLTFAYLGFGFACLSYFYLLLNRDLGNPVYGIAFFVISGLFWFLGYFIRTKILLRYPKEMKFRSQIVAYEIVYFVISGAFVLNALYVIGSPVVQDIYIAEVLVDFFSSHITDSLIPAFVYQLSLFIPLTVLPIIILKVFNNKKRPLLAILALFLMPIIFAVFFLTGALSEWAAFLESSEFLKQPWLKSVIIGTPSLYYLNAALRGSDWLEKRGREKTGKKI